MKEDLRMNSFYVEMDASLMHTMNIPKKFSKTLKGSKSEIVRLEGPSGFTWHVKMIRSKNTFSLQSGWNQFVVANRIDKNDFLVFRYNGNSSFKVLIFDRSGCQKAASFFTKRSEMKMVSEESSDSSIQEIASPHDEVKKEIISLSSDNNDTYECSSDISPHAPCARTPGKGVCSKMKQRDFVQELTESESDDGEHKIIRKRKTRENRTKKDSSLYVVPQRTHLTPAQKEIANRMIQKAQKGSDLFVKILTPVNTRTDFNCVLNFPDDFVCKFLESKKKKITMLPSDLDKRNSVTGIYYLMNKRTGCIKTGWRQFAHRNGLKPGDLCLFELRKQDKQGILTMVVHCNN